MSRMCRDGSGYGIRLLGVTSNKLVTFPRQNMLLRLGNTRTKPTSVRKKHRYIKAAGREPNVPCTVIPVSLQFEFLEDLVQLGLHQ